MEHTENTEKSSNNIIAIIALVLSIIVGLGLVVLYFIYFFRTPVNINYSIWTTVNVSGDSSGSGGSNTATFAPNINYVYILNSSITNVVLLTPTVPNYAGTTFIIKTASTLVPTLTNITPPPGVNINLLSKLPSDSGFLFIWNNNGTVLNVS